MIKIFGPTDLEAPLEYALDFIFCDVFGLSWAYDIHEYNNYCIKSEWQSTSITMPAIFLPKLTHRSEIRKLISLEFVQKWNSEELGLNFNITQPEIPVLFQKSLMPSYISTTEVALPIDIFGTVFFMLSNYEEMMVATKDTHNRMSSKFSLAYKSGYLLRPIIDEYIEIIWQSMRYLWPNLNRKAEPKSLNISCDVDRPYEVGFRTKDFLRGLKSDIVDNLDVPNGLRNLKKRFAYLRGNFQDDLYLQNLNKMMDIAEHNNQKMIFYFLSGGTHHIDGYYDISQPVIRKLLRDIHLRGHEIGIHGSYLSHYNEKCLQREKENLIAVLEKLKIPHYALKSRQHYLRWDHLETPQILEACGITVDSSLAFADHAGFRCGTSRNFKMYDLINNQKLNLIQQPLIMMETTIFGASYQGFACTKHALDYMISIKDTALTMGNQFTYLWHNCSFDSERAFEYYSALAQA